MEKESDHAKVVLSRSNTIEFHFISLHFYRNTQLIHSHAFSSHKLANTIAHPSLKILFQT